MLSPDHNLRDSTLFIVLCYPPKSHSRLETERPSQKEAPRWSDSSFSSVPGVPMLAAHVGRNMDRNGGRSACALFLGSLFGGQKLN